MYGMFIAFLCSRVHAKVNLMYVILTAVISLSNLECFFGDQFNDSSPEANGDELDAIDTAPFIDS
jgi:hypothetical protein